MDSNLNVLKNNFSIIVTMRTEIQSTFNNLEVKISKLKEIYSNLLKNNNQSSYTFGLDSLSFQRKLIDVELNHMKQFYLLLNNRIYCEYYKLYKIISIYIITGRRTYRRRPSLLARGQSATNTCV